MGKRKHTRRRSAMRALSVACAALCVATLGAEDPAWGAEERAAAFERFEAVSAFYAARGEVEPPAWWTVKSGADVVVEDAHFSPVHGSYKAVHEGTVAGAAGAGGTAAGAEDTAAGAVCAGAALLATKRCRLLAFRHVCVDACRCIS